MTYTVEVVWNREFVFVPIWSSRTPDLNIAVARAEELENMGDGARVKKARIVDQDGVVVWQYGKRVSRSAKIPSCEHHDRG